jgi:RNA polymerase sigma factor (sigma-70 family)
VQRTLWHVFRKFDPAKYKGSKPIEHHFLNYFMRHLRGDLSREGWPRTDQGRAGDPARFRARPELGLRKVERECLQTKWAKQDLREAVEDLPPGKRDVIRGRYWNSWSDRRIGAWLNIDHKTVKSWHDAALLELKSALAA